MRDFTINVREKQALITAVQEVAEKVQSNYRWYCCESNRDEEGNETYTEYTDEDSKAKIKAYETIMKALKKLI